MKKISILFLIFLLAPCILSAEDNPSILTFDITEIQDDFLSIAEDLYGRYSFLYNVYDFWFASTLLGIDDYYLSSFPFKLDVEKNELGQDDTNPFILFTGFVTFVGMSFISDSLHGDTEKLLMSINPAYY